MARRYWAEIDGRRLYRDTIGEIQRLAQAAANKLGRSVQLGYEDTKPRKRTLKRNPVMQGHDYTGEEWKITARGPHGRTLHSYADSERQAKAEIRVLRASGYHVTHLVRLQAPNQSAPPARRRR